VCLDRIERRCVCGDEGVIGYIAELKKYYDIFFKYNEHRVVNSNKSVEEIADDIISLIS
jgi:hypothetical protein